jgi:hypothetical protein
MVALPSNMRESAFLQLKAAYARLCAVHAKLQDRWNESAYSPDEFGPRRRAINELRSELRQAHSDFDAAPILPGNTRLPGLPDIELRNSRQQATGSESIALVLSRTLCRYQGTVCGLG